MTNKDKVKQIRQWYKQGIIKKWWSDCYSVPFEAAQLGITPELVIKVLKRKEVNNEKGGIS